MTRVLRDAPQRSPQPPYIRAKPPQGRLQSAASRILAGTEWRHEEHDLVWDDGVAAETCIDFDAPHARPSFFFRERRRVALAALCAALSCFGIVYQIIKWSDPQGINPAYRRKVGRDVLPIYDITKFDEDEDD
ncbi:hypothetical protein M885DRAFT_577194 [Pelagophyceae sp. CCMP2097]|nr:hypothetical protein M885DRAFT_577194 [Pelagophyceae sp. CCMP2097]